MQSREPHPIDPESIDWEREAERGASSLGRSRGRRSAPRPRLRSRVYLLTAFVLVGGAVFALVSDGEGGSRDTPAQPHAVNETTEGPGATNREEPLRQDVPPDPRVVKPAPAFTARQVSDLTMRRITKAQEIANATRGLGSLIATLSADGHRFPDNSVIWVGAGGSVMRVTYRDWQGSKGIRRIPEHLRYRGTELGPGERIRYEFPAIRSHALYLWDPQKHADLKTRRWPGSRYGRPPDAHERRVIDAHHAIWRAEAELREIEAELDRLGG